MIGLIMFGVALLMLLVGFPVAFTFGGVAVFFGLLAEGPEIFSLMPHRIWSIMNNTILMAIPLFIFMGIVLQKSNLAERLLESMGFLFGEIRGGIAISTILVGALLAASTGVVGASVVAMGVISLPVMLKYSYDKRLAAGTICAAGTLGQIIPPSIVLIILGDVFQEPVGDLFKAALWPGLSLVVFYIAYVVIITLMNKELAPPIRLEEMTGSKKQQIFQALKAVVPPLVLIILVLGSILTGVATPTESSSVGGVGAIVLATLYGRFSIGMVWESSLETVKISAMVFAILIGATAFSMVFTYTGGDWIVEDFMLSLPGEKWGRKVGIPDPFHADHHSPGFLYRFCRDLLHRRANPGADSSQPRHQPGLVRHPGRDEPADLIPDAAIWVQPLLPQGCGTCRSQNNRYLLWRDAFHYFADDRAGYSDRVPAVVRVLSMTPFQSANADHWPVEL